MLDIEPDLGRHEDVASGGATTIVLNPLKMGTLSAERYIRKWLLRATAAASADLVRVCSNFASSTGTLTHAGDDYTNSPTSAEVLEILEHEPYLYGRAINRTLDTLPRLDREIIPTIANTRNYWLHNLSWVSIPSDVYRVLHSSSPVLSRNRFLARWNSIDSAGAFEPDSFTLAGSDATMARQSTIVRRGQYSCGITRAGTDATFRQSVGLLWNGVSGDSIRSETVTVVASVYATTASQVRVQILDGVNTNNTSYHTGGGSWEELTTEVTVDSAATQLTFGLSIETSDGTVYVEELYLIWGSLNDAVRQDSYTEREMGVSFAQGAATLEMIIPYALSLGSQIIIESWRHHATLSGEGDNADAKLNDVAIGAIANIYKALAREEGGSPRYREMADYYGRRWDEIGRENVYLSDNYKEWGMPFPTPLVGPRARRF